MSKKKLLVLVFSALFIFAILFCRASLSLSDHDINGVDGTFGIVRLTFSSNNNVKISDNSTQYLITHYSDTQKDDENIFNFIRKYADSFDGTYPNAGKFIKDGKEYSFGRRAFTHYFWIVTIEEDVN